MRYVSQQRFFVGDERLDALSHRVEVPGQDADLVVLARYMQVLSESFVAHYPNRVINIHPALLPAFPGIDGQQQAFDAGVQIAGATVHLVDSGMDTGPIIAQGAVPRLPGDTAVDLKQRILSVEHQLFSRVLRWAAQGRIKMDQGVVQVDLPQDEQRWIWCG